MKTIVTSLLLDLTSALVAAAVTPLILLAWLRHRAMERRTLFNAANCAEYQNTESGTNYTAQEVDDAYRRAKLVMWIDEIQERVTK